MKRATTQICYQVESSRGVEASNVGSLRAARTIVNTLRRRGVGGARIMRLDRSGRSRHYEEVK